MSLGLAPVEGVMRRYAWGSPTAIPELLGIPVTGQPVAELWFDRQLPLLLKLLAADKPLSLQVHPNLDQARAGFAAEQLRGIPQNAPGRNYPDANHKPELLYALTPFEALCGFRPVADTARLLEALNVAELMPVQAALGGPHGLREAFSMILSTPASQAPSLLAAVAGACRRRIHSGGEWRLAAQASLVASEHFPGDIGAVLTLLLNAVRLAPGEAIFLDAGNVHGYLSGLGVEIMANSDNVLRCGLTSKHVDIAEVLRVADFTPLVEPRYRPDAEGWAERPVFAPVPDFELSVVTVHSGHRGAALAAGPSHLLLCTEGLITVTAGTEALALRPGHAAYVASGRPTLLSGGGVVFQATTR